MSKKNGSAKHVKGEGVTDLGIWMVWPVISKIWLVILTEFADREALGFVMTTSISVRLLAGAGAA
ncbi:MULTISPECIES: hypothetical protein [Vibrio]|uniref:hypothetical protein n=1 Tax=Vibrio TaxID=662 RepID=UPI0001B93B82|nr:MULTISPECIES: hypothetical protein [Vibrio]EEX34405.1 hypothetical protein VIC_001203 [Vibrio coralliilyticus ATCC BAA-450]MDE3898447.1 hypothetical protein [Vibrio sp. CC007]